MKTPRPCQFEDCGQSKNSSRHFGADADHEYQPEARAGFGSQRQPINLRSAKRERYMETERRPAVRKAVGNGRKPCPVKSPHCTGYVEGIHETAPRGRFGGLEAAVDAAPTVGCCHACNSWLSEHPREAQERGLLRSNTLTGEKSTFQPLPKIRRGF